MSVQFKTALAAAIEAHIDTLSDGDALFGTVLLKEGRGKVNAAAKICRIQMKDGAMTKSNEAKLAEMQVGVVLQFYKKPTAQTVEAIDAASDESFEMARAGYDFLEGSNLNGACCDVTFPEEPDGNYEMGTANLFATVFGATYLYGVINP